MNAPLCRRCRRTCKQMTWAKIVTCPAFIQREGGGAKDSKIVTDSRRRSASEAEGRLLKVLQRPSADGARTEEEENGGKNE